VEAVGKDPCGRNICARPSGSGLSQEAKSSVLIRQNRLIAIAGPLSLWGVGALDETRFNQRGTHRWLSDRRPNAMLGGLAFRMWYTSTYWQRRCGPLRERGFVEDHDVVVAGQDVVDGHAGHLHAGLLEDPAEEREHLVAPP